MPKSPQHKWDGCSRRCSKRHTYVWGQCEFATPPEPYLLIGLTFRAADGYLATSIQRLRQSELARAITAAQMQAGHKPEDMAKYLIEYLNPQKENLQW